MPASVPAKIVPGSPGSIARSLTQRWIPVSRCTHVSPPSLELKIPMPVPALITSASAGSTTNAPIG